MKVKLNLDVQPFTTPNFVRLAVDSGDATKEGYPVSIKELDAETLERLCEQFREDVFTKAGKRDPANDRPTCA